MCVHYNLTSKTAAVMLDTDPATGGRGNIYYVDNDGDKHWTQAELPEEMVQQAFAACKSVMADREINQGYAIRRTILFDNACGFVLGENPKAQAPFVTWQFNEQDGHRDYFWGHYHTDSRQAEADLSKRAVEYQRQYRVRLVRDTGLPPRQPTIAQQMKQAQKQVEANRDNHTHKKDAPDRGDR